jgi:hypothetical protein
MTMNYSCISEIGLIFCRETKHVFPKNIANTGVLIKHNRYICGYFLMHIQIRNSMSTQNFCSNQGSE